MSEKISIACPSCQKGYSVPANLGDRKLKCKACGSAFRLSDLLPPQATPVPAPPEPAVDASLEGKVDSDLQRMFKPSVSNAMPSGNVAEANPYNRVAKPELGRIEVEHRANSKMLFAILGSVVFSMLIIPACYVITSVITSSFVKDTKPQPRNQKQRVSAVGSVANFPQSSSEPLNWKSE